MRNEAAVHVLELGNLEWYSPAQRRERMDQLVSTQIRLGTRYFVVELSDVGLADAAITPLELLLGNERLRSAGCSVAIVCADESVRRVLALIGAGESISIYPSVAAALRELGAHSD